ncbi:MAG: tryptophan/tyrosine permease, partial [Gammaproteobacteria bacterium]|nr:tryptophan/tyrosine permease [Gammaproteobacteria bacterium]
WCLLKVNLWLPPESNLISMSEATLGKTIKAITWVVYLLLLYSLICAYLAATGDVLAALLTAIHIPISRSLSTWLSAFVIGAIVYHGIRSVDLVNRVLMSVKLFICIAIIAFVAPHVQLQRLAVGSMVWHGNVWLVIICAFGYAIILPSIRVYLNSNEKQLSRVVWVGSLIPMIIYLVWIAVIQGALPRSGPTGLAAMAGSENTNSMLMMQLVAISHHTILQSMSVIFISICSITGLLGVSLCLTDFLADGLKKAKQGWNKLLLVGLTFMPGVLIILLNPAFFIGALAYAGFFCLYILVALPIAMYVVGRHKGFRSHSSTKIVTTNPPARTVSTD